MSVHSPPLGFVMQKKRLQHREILDQCLVTSLCRVCSQQAPEEGHRQTTHTRSHWLTSEPGFSQGHTENGKRRTPKKSRPLSQPSSGRRKIHSIHNTTDACTPLADYRGP